jgi:hypothetical protein
MRQKMSTKDGSKNGKDRASAIEDKIISQIDRKRSRKDEDITIKWSPAVWRCLYQHMADRAEGFAARLSRVEPSERRFSLRKSAEARRIADDLLAEIEGARQ